MDEKQGTETAPRVTDSPELHADVNVDDTRARYWEYIGDEERVYTNVPVTVQKHEIIKYPHIPAEDGRWEEVEFDESKGWTVKPADNAMISDNTTTPGE